MKLTPKQIRRNVFRFMGFDLPNDMLDNAHDIKADGDKIKFKTKAEVNTDEWLGCYGSVEKEVE